MTHTCSKEACGNCEAFQQFISKLSPAAQSNLCHRFGSSCPHACTFVGNDVASSAWGAFQPPDTAEIAVATLDSHQNRGYAKKSLLALAELLSTMGITRLIAYIFGDNYAAVKLARTFGSTHYNRANGSTEIEIDTPHRLN